ncbi:LysR family transcriptional regulator [Streptomyces sp. ERV7]|uniref:LysR family transcriptional regulator n=1 Tax=Streptomyces sp. ERV7 TaxID=1322334 RepID=UPI0007F4EA14|nr:LysR family transcriptional regulator [Streptomyces sp. ERV7]OAR26502.1 LysR family transcriptional regulator [Streptomyces sp. ERV7]
MDPHLLRTLVAVVEHRSFSAAAQALGYTQSAVSQHIAALEADLGAKLVERRPVGPTAAGERLMEHARPLLLRLDAARADLARLHTVRTTSLTVVCTPAALTPSLAAALARVRRAAPGLAAGVRVLGPGEVVRAVVTGEADLGLVDGAAAPNDPLPLPDAGPMVTVTVAEEPLAVLLPAGHPLAGRAALRLADLADAHWIDAPDTAVPLAQLRAAAHADGFRPRLAYGGSDLRGLARLVAAGHGLVATGLTAAAGEPGTVAVRVRAPRLVHRTEAVHPRTPAGPVPALVEALGHTG